jgi:hypothetical protein
MIPDYGLSELGQANLLSVAFRDRVGFTRAGNPSSMSRISGNVDNAAELFEQYENRSVSLTVTAGSLDEILLTNQ